MEYLNIIIPVAVILIVTGIFVMHQINLKKQIRAMRQQLEDTKEFSYNKQIQVTLIDKELEALATEINKNIDYQKELKLEYEAGERQLKQSISDIAHDLRTPLTVIKGNLQLLEQSFFAYENSNSEDDINKNNIDKNNEDMSNTNGNQIVKNIKPYEALGGYIDICKEKADVLKQMIDDFFEMSVLESDIDEVPLQNINATNLLMQFIIDHEALIREKELTPEIRLPEKTIMLKGDASFIGRMLSNLLNNILKYGRKSFEIGLTEETGSVIIYFSNEISKGTNIEADRLFERTYRADRSRSEGSAGLGLYIVKILAKKQGGDATAEIDDRRLVVKLSFMK